MRGGRSGLSAFVFFCWRPTSPMNPCRTYGPVGHPNTAFRESFWRASLVVMPLLSRAKRKVGRALGSAAMRADAKQTEFCTCLSAILLAGLLLNALSGWWCADPAAALLIVPIIAKEGFEGLQGKACDDCGSCAV